MARMIITLISPVFPYPHSGIRVGIERHVLEYSLALMRKGHHVNIVTTFWNGGEEEEIYHGMRIYRVKDSYYKYGKLGRQFDLPHVTFSRNILKYSDIFSTSDVVHTITPIYTAFFKDNGIPAVTHFHHKETIRRPIEILKYPFIVRNYRKALFHYDAVLTMTYSGKESLISEFSVADELITIVPHGVDLSRFEARKKDQNDRPETVLLYVGGLYKRKGLRYLVEAIGIARRKGSKVKLVIVGEGEEKKKLTKHIRRMRLEKNVELKGYLTDEQVSEEYKNSDVFVFPSLQEGFGIPLVEAMAAGLPIISTNTSSIPEVVGDAGILVEAGNANELANAIVTVSENEELRRELIGKGNKRVRECFTWDSVVDRIVDVYFQVMNTKVSNQDSQGSVV